MKTVVLNNGVVMPQIGYGVYQVSSAECERCVSDALSVGYRMIDTAQAYHNEEGVGAAVKKSVLPVMNSSLCQRSGFPTMASTKQRLPLTKACANSAQTIST